MIKSTSKIGARLIPATMVLAGLLFARDSRAAAVDNYQAAACGSDPTAPYCDWTVDATSQSDIFFANGNYINISGVSDLTMTGTFDITTGDFTYDSGSVSAGGFSPIYNSSGTQLTESGFPLAPMRQ